MLLRLLRAADRTEIESTVVTLLNLGPLRDGVVATGTPLVPVGMDGVASAAGSLMRLARAIRDARPDVVQGWLLQGNLAASAASALSGVRCPVLWNVRWTLYGLDGESWRTRAMIRASALLSHRTHRVIFNASRAAVQHAAFGFRADRAVVIPNGFDCTRFRPDAPSRAATRNDLGVTDETIVVGHVGRHHPMKDHHNAAEAARRLLDAGVRAHIVFVGRGVPDGDALSANIERLGLASHVTRLGDRTDTPALYNAFDVQLVSSWARGVSEGFPNVLGEAMATGIPCVTTDTGEAAEVVGDTGLVVPPRDPASLGDALIAMCRRTAAERHALGVRARARILDRYEIGAVTRRYLDLWRGAVA